jgi:hypothetical protein
MKIIKNFKIIILIITYSIISVHLNAQSVENVRASRAGDNIVVKYEITDARPGQKFDVSLYVSRDGGKTFEGPLKSVIGNAGKGIKPGEHQLVWKVYKDVNSLEGDIVFDVKARIMEDGKHKKKKKIKEKTNTNKPEKTTSAESNPQKHFMVSYNGNPDAPLGFAIGQLGKIGWYLSAEKSLEFSKPKYTYESESWDPDFDMAKYYEFSDTKDIRRLSISGGLTIQLSKSFYLYTGAGYGIKDLIWQIDIYDYETELKTGEEYVKNLDYSYSGLEFETGLIVRMGTFLLQGGITTVNFKYTNWTFGVGLAF